MSNITPAEIAAWHRSQAKHHIQEAERLEQDYNLKPTPPKQEPVAPLNGNGHSAPLDEIVAYLKNIGAKRPADIATKLGVRKELVDATIDANPGVLIRASKGWIKLKEESAV